MLAPFECIPLALFLLASPPPFDAFRTHKSLHPVAFSTPAERLRWKDCLERRKGHRQPQYRFGTCSTCSLYMPYPCQQNWIGPRTFLQLTFVGSLSLRGKKEEIFAPIICTAYQGGFPDCVCEQWFGMHWLDYEFALFSCCVYK